jgi:cyclophilin family peptidyl-prolyl cis-trans isomerase
MLKGRSGIKPVLAMVLALTILMGGCFGMQQDIAPQKPAQPVSETVVLETNFGNIEIELFRHKAPKTVENFVKLVREGFYDGTRFHRVIGNFMIQGGCPYSADVAKKHAWGTGGPGYKINCEIHDANFNVKGTIAKANAGPNTNGSQFFINVANNDWLNKGHTVFGKVTSGIDIVETISKVQTGQRDIPQNEVLLKRAFVK